MSMAATVHAATIALFAIWGLLRILEQFSSWPFVIYRGLIGLLLLVGAATGLLT